MNEFGRKGTQTFILQTSLRLFYIGYYPRYKLGLTDHDCLVKYNDNTQTQV